MSDKPESHRRPEDWLGHGSPEWPHGPPSAHERDGLLDLALRFVALARRNWILMLVCVGASVGVFAQQSRSERSTYRARAVIQLRDKADALGGLSGGARSGLGPDAMMSQIRVLHSRAVAREVAQRRGLRLRILSRALPPGAIEQASVAADAQNGSIRLAFEDDGFLATRGGTRTRGAYGVLVDIGGVRFRVPRNPGIEIADLRVVSADDAADEVLAALRGQPSDRTTVIDVTYTSYDPVAAQEGANTAVAVFQELNARTERQQSVRRREFIQQQIDKTEAGLAEAQLQYSRFAARTQVLGSRDKVVAQHSAIADLESRRAQLEADQHSYLATLDSLENPRFAADFNERLSVLVASPGVAGNPLVTALYGQLSRYEAARDTVMVGTMAMAAGSPDVMRLDTLVASTRAALLRALRPQVAAIGGRIAALEALRARVSENLSSLPRTEVEESALRAQVEMYRRQADRLRDAIQSALIDEAVEAGQVEIIDLATLPSAPLNQGKAPKFILAIAFGLALGSGLGYVRENRRDVIRRREELGSVSPLPNLAMVPQIRLHGRQSRRGIHVFAPGTERRPSGELESSPSSTARSLVTVVDPRSVGAEAYRTLRTNLLFSDAAHALKRVAVSSAGPQEGKSTTAANLAVACAQQGQRVLLIDGDLRGAQVHAFFNRGRAPGLTDILVGRVPLMDAITTSAVDGLSVLTAGAVAPNPTELLGSSRMRQLMDDLAARFDILIVDTTPLLAASDAAVLARMVDGTLMVVRAGHTERAAVQEAIQQLINVGARLLGTVLNDPDAEVAKYAPYYHEYYYNYYHRRSAEST